MFLETNDFSSFVVIYKYRSIAKSAKLLEKSSATLSYLLKKMETQFARKLFTRSQKELLPNRFAEELLPVALKICRIMNATGALLQKGHDHDADVFKREIQQAATDAVGSFTRLEGTALVEAIKSPLRIAQLIKVNVLSKNNSVAATARRLKISQPSLHIQLKELESVLGLPLFISKHKSTSLTDTGRLLNEAAKLVMEQIEELDGFAKSQYYHVSSALRFGMVPVSGTQSRLTKLLTDFIDRWKQNYSSPLEIITDPAELLVQKLEDNAIDAAVIDVDQKVSFLSYKKIIDDELHLILPQKPKAKETFQALLTKYPLVLPSKGTGIRKSIDTAFQAAGIECAPEMTINSIPLLINLVQEKNRSTILPSSAFGKDAQTVHLHRLPVPIKRTIHLVYRTENASSLLTRQMMACFKD